MTGSTPNLGSQTGANVSCRNNSKYMKFIRERLDATNLQKFRESCFGHFLDVDTKHSQGQLVYLMYKHLDPKAIERRRISFIINERVFELGPVEYFIITGLRFQGWQDPPTFSTIHDEIFNGDNTLYVKDIYEAFDKHSSMDKGKGDTVLKLALLLVLYETLLVRHRTSKRIEVRFMHVVDNLEKFNRFPWGLVSYQFLVIASYNAKVIIDKCLDLPEPTKPAFDVYGFNYAVQVFAYEVHRDIAKHCAKPIEDTSNAFPRMRRWSTQTFHHLSGIIQYFERSYATSMQTMEYNAEEIDKLASEKICNDMSCPVAIKKLFEHFKALKPEGFKQLKRQRSDSASKSSKKQNVVSRGPPGVPTTNDYSPQRSTPDSGFSQAYEDSIPTVENASSNPVLKLFNVLLQKFTAMEHEVHKKVTTVETLVSEIQSDIKNLKNSCSATASDSHNHHIRQERTIVDHSIHLQSNVFRDEYDHSSRPLYDLYDTINFPPLLVKEPETKTEPISFALPRLHSGFASHVMNSNIIVENRLQTPFHSPSSVQTLTGGSCVRLPSDCLNQIGDNQAVVFNKSFTTPSINAFSAQAMNPANLATVKPRVQVPRRKQIILPGYLTGGNKPYPLEIESTTALDEFQKWYSENNCKRDQSETVDVPREQGVQASWFNALWSERGKLHTLIVDSLLDMVLINVKESPAKFNDNWSVLDQKGWQSLMGKNKSKTNTTALEYLRGNLPRERPVPWVNVEKVYGIGFSEPDHWVCYEVQFKKQLIVVYDSLSKSESQAKNTMDSFKFFSINIAMLLERGGIWDRVGDGTDLKSPWPIHIQQHPSQQPNNHDCGVLALKFLQCLVSGNPLSILRPTNITDTEFANVCYLFRKSYALQLKDAGQQVDWTRRRRRSKK